MIELRYELLLFIPILLIVEEGLKKHPTFRKNMIPITLLMVGIVLSTIYGLYIKDIVKGLVSGIVATSIATYTFELMFRTFEGEK